MIKATIFDIVRNSYVDGPGIRTTVFFKGCNLNCAWCHNPESKSNSPEMMFYKELCNGCGRCKKVCPEPNNCILCGKCEAYCPKGARIICGKEYTIEEVFNEIIKDKSYYDNSGGGVTFSGGEAMLQIDFLYEILKKCKENGIHTAIDTAGFVTFDKFEKILEFTDLILFDIKVFDNEKHKKYVGVNNKLILENLKKLFELDVDLWIRIPIIPSVNDDLSELENIKNLIFSYGNPQKIELLPYHNLGENKAIAINKHQEKFMIPKEELMKKFNSIFY